MSNVVIFKYQLYMYLYTHIHSPSDFEYLAEINSYNKRY